MLKLLIQYPNGDQRIEEYGPGGGPSAPGMKTIWNWETDGEPPTTLSLDFMERVEKIEYAADENGKRLYEWVEPAEGDQKKDRRKVQVRHLVTYLRNNRLGKIGRSNRKPKKLPPGE